MEADLSQSYRAQLVAALEQAGRVDGAVTFLGGSTTSVTSWSELLDEAATRSTWFRDRSAVASPRVVVVSSRSERSVVAAFLGVLLCGGTATILPGPRRGQGHDAYLHHLRAQIDFLSPEFVLLDDRLAESAEPTLAPTQVSLSSMEREARRMATPSRRADPADDAAPAILQFTSGSTLEPRAVEVHAAALLANVEAMRVGMQLDPAADHFVSWLPLYHDMGLIGHLLLPLLTGTPLSIAASSDFIAAPRRWLEWMSDQRGTISTAPNFAYDLARRSSRGAFDLRSWRLALNGAEPIRAETMRSFCESFASAGFRETAPLCVYGMAEATLAVTFPVPETGMVAEVVDAHSLIEGASVRSGASPAGPSKELVRLGGPVAGLSLRLTHDGESLPAGVVGEVEIAGTSVAPRYFRGGPASDATFANGWLRSGDLGYLVDGELVIVGRKKDMIVVRGRNVAPQDVEWAISRVPGVRPGGVVAFGSEHQGGSEQIVVVAEAVEGSPPSIKLIREEVAVVAGSMPADVVLVAPGSVMKTSSGKVQRSLCRHLYEDGSFEALRSR